MECPESARRYKEQRISLAPFSTLQLERGCGDTKLNYIINSNMCFMSKSNFPSDSSHERYKKGSNNGTHPYNDFV
jgi:hypothetical protein